MRALSKLMAVLLLASLLVGCGRVGSGDGGRRPGQEEGGQGTVGPVRSGSTPAGGAAATPSQDRASAGSARGRTAQSLPADPPGNAVARGLTPAQRTVDHDDAGQVASAFVVRLQAWDTRLDRRPNDAARRAVGFADPALRARLLATEPRAAPGRRWNDLVEHNGWTSVRTRLGGLGPEPTTDNTAARAVTAIPVDHGADGWTAFPDTDWTYIVTLRRQREHRGRNGPPSAKMAEWTVVGYTIQ